MWFRADGPPAGWLLAHEDKAASDFALGIVDGRLTLEVRDGAAVVRGGTAIEPGRWYHAVAVLDAEGALARVYLDGQLDGEAVLLGEAAALDAPWLLGARGAVVVADGDPGEDRDGRLLERGRDGFTGALDEVAVYGLTLPEDVIREHATRGAR